jgi:hypothetical protein
MDVMKIRKNKNDKFKYKIISVSPLRFDAQGFIPLLSSGGGRWFIF